LTFSPLTENSGIFVYIGYHTRWLIKKKKSKFRNILIKFLTGCCSWKSDHFFFVNSYSFHRILSSQDKIFNSLLVYWKSKIKIMDFSSQISTTMRLYLTWNLDKLGKIYTLQKKSFLTRRINYSFFFFFLKKSWCFFFQQLLLWFGTRSWLNKLFHCSLDKQNIFYGATFVDWPMLFWAIYMYRGTFLHRRVVVLNLRLYILLFWLKCVGELFSIAGTLFWALICSHSEQYVSGKFFR